MGIWDCLSCWNTLPKTRPEPYEIRYNIYAESCCEFDILVEKLIVVGVPYPLLCPGIDIDACCCKQTKCLSPEISPTCSLLEEDPITAHCREIMKKQQKKKDSSEETTEDEDTEQSEDDKGFTKSVISRSSHRSELNDERLVKNNAIKVNKTASGAGIVVPNPQNYEEKYYRDFILKYGTIFTDNIKDPIPKDPNPLNPSNIVKIKPLNLPSTSQRKDYIKNGKQIQTCRTSKIQATNTKELKNSKQQDSSETEQSSSEVEDESNESYVSVIHQHTQTKNNSQHRNPTLQFQHETQNFAIAQSSLSTTSANDTELFHNKNQIEKIILDGPREVQVEGTSSGNHRGKKALRWKIIIRHQTPSTEQAEVMTDDLNSDLNIKDIRTDSNSSSDSGYLQYDYVDD